MCWYCKLATILNTNNDRLYSKIETNLSLKKSTTWNIFTDMFLFSKGFSMSTIVKEENISHKKEGSV